MALAPQIYLELENVEVPARDGGEFDVRKFMAIEGRGFLEVLHFGVGRHDKPLYVYEAIPFSITDFADASGLSAREKILKNNYLLEMQGAGLDETRLIKIDAAFDQAVADILGQSVTQEPALEEGDGFHRPVIGYLQKNPGLK